MLHYSLCVSGVCGVSESVAFSFARSAHACTTSGFTHGLEISITCDSLPFIFLFIPSQHFYFLLFFIFIMSSTSLSMLSFFWSGYYSLLTLSVWINTMHKNTLLSCVCCMFCSSVSALLHLLGEESEFSLFYLISFFYFVLFYSVSFLLTLYYFISFFLSLMCCVCMCRERASASEHPLHPQPHSTAYLSAEDTLHTLDV